jgi:hypothetical protein
MDDFESILKALRSCSPEQKQEIFNEIRDSIQIHELETHFNVRADVILEAIARADDLTQRGVRGVIAETIFALDVAPKLRGWRAFPATGTVAYDLLLVRGLRNVRVQVKMQRKEKGKPKVGRSGHFVAEVQRTRSGNKKGQKTRPYRFNEFDLLAVCMEPSTRSWTSFMYAATKNLAPNPNDATVIKTFQEIPAFSSGRQGIWIDNLQAALNQLP